MYSEYRADIVISMNEKGNQPSGAERQVDFGSVSLDDIFFAMIRSFQIVDYGLFA